jgi:hypothetical protein
MFILLIALLIILGLHCAYSAPLTNIHNKSYDIENIENFETSRQESNISTSNINTNAVDQGYDPEVNKLLGYCYYDNTPSCNKTDLPIHGCATTEPQGDVYEFFNDATVIQQQSGSSAIYGRPLPPALGVVASEETPTSSINSCPTSAGSAVASTAPASTACAAPASTSAPQTETCIPSQYEQCRDCDITTNKNINKYVLKNSIPPDKDMSLYAKKANLCPCTDMSKYMLKSAIPACDNQNLSNYIKKSEIPACPVCPTCPTCPKPTAGHIHDHPDYRKYISRRDCEKQCTSHINKKPDVDINDPSFKKAVDKYIKNNNYIKKSDDNGIGIGNGLSYENKGVNLAMNKGANANANTNHNMNQNTNHNQNINTSTNANTGSNYDTARKQNINSPNAPYAPTNAPYAPTNAPYAHTNAPYSPTNVPQKYRTNKTSTVGYSTTGDYNDLYQRC